MNIAENLYPGIGLFRVLYWQAPAVSLIDRMRRSKIMMTGSDPKEENTLPEDGHKRLQDFTAASQDWFWEMDSDLRYTWISSKIESMLDVKREDLYGKTRTQISGDPEEAQKWEQHLKLLENRQSFQNFDYKYQFKPGKSGWARISGSPFYDEAGEFAGYRGTATNITSIKQMELEAKRAADRFSRATQYFSGGLLLYDEEDTVVQFSRQLSEIYPTLKHKLKPGISQEQWLRAQLNAGLVPEAVGCEEEWLQDRLAEDCESAAVREVERNGRWYRINRTNIPEGGWLHILIDITDQRDVERKVAEERNLLRAIIDNIPDLIYAKDKDCKFIVANKAIVETLTAGTDHKPDIIGKDDYAFHSRSDAQRFIDREVNLLKSGELIEDDLTIHKDPYTSDSYWISTNKVPLRDTTGNTIGLVGCGRNITKQHQLTVELQHTQQRFRDFAETAADWFWESDSELSIDYLSERFLELTGNSQEQVIGKSLSEFIGSFLKNENDRPKLAMVIERGEEFSDYELAFTGSDGEVQHFVFSGKPYFNNESAFCGYRGVGRNVTHTNKLQDELAYRAQHDMLTGLENRQQFEMKVRSELAAVKATGKSVVVGYLDLDQFKIVNDTVGHSAGDHLLCQIAELLRKQLDEKHVLARLGGDEFGLLFCDLAIGEADQLAGELILALSEYRFVWEQRVFSVGGSIGLVELHEHNEGVNEILSQADMACFAAKDMGRNRSHTFTWGDRQLEQRHHEMLAASGIRSALESDRFRLFMQPIAEIGSNPQQIHHYEILLRMEDEQGNLVPPGAFIPAAERYGLMGEIDRWVVANALANFNQVFSQNNTCGITINLSGSSMSETSLFSFIRDLLCSNDVDPSRICFELTETAVINNMETARNFMQDIKSIGCSLALDDFGSGLSSFTYLKSFDVDFLKIDGSFVRDLVDDQTDRVVVTAINDIGHGMGMKTIAEFVENDDILQVLQELRVDYAQGFGIGKPVPYLFENLLGLTRSAA